MGFICIIFDSVSSGGHAEECSLRSTKLPFHVSKAVRGFIWPRDECSNKDILLYETFFGCEVVMDFLLCGHWQNDNM